MAGSGLMVEHPVAELLRAAAAGNFPAADGGWSRLPTWRPGTGAVIALTGHAVVCGSDLTDAELTELGVDGVGGATLPPVMSALAGPDGWIDCLDVLMVARGRGLTPPPLSPRPDLADHPRAVHASEVRDDVTVYGYADPARRDLATVGKGLGGLTLIGMEVERPGHGSRILDDLLDTLPDDLVFAGVAPGNARSFRLLARTGFVVLGSVQLFTTTPH